MPVPVVLGWLTMRKGGERRRAGIKLVVAGLAVGLLSFTVYVIAAWQGWL